MSQLSKIPPSALEKLSPEKHKNIVLNELKREDVLAHIAGLLHDVARLYQIPNWGVTESVNLAGWILRTYKYETLGIIQRSLSAPPKSETVWRLTPDTISKWVEPYLESISVERENRLHNEPLNELPPLKEEEIKEGVPQEWPEERLKEWEDQIVKAPVGKPIASLTQEDILKEGQEKPIVKPPILPMDEIAVEIREIAQEYGLNFLQVKELRRQWGLEVHDKLTGKKLPTWVNFREWLIS